ncbi:MAG: BamA/TamA family outer membrane protein [Bacteroidota bacterium]|nr:BamA/TamA family outer membrane protein [Bacteroidota bacterium]
MKLKIKYQMLKLYIYIILIILLQSCTGLKYVPKGESLYTGAKINVNAIHNSRDQKKAVSEIKNLISPKPNRKVLGSRPFLWIWYIAGTPKKEKGFRYMLKNRIGEPPVYMSMSDPTLASKAIDAKLYNMGFFTSYSQYEIHEDKNQKKTSVTYQLFIAEPYRYEDIIFPKDSDILSKEIRSTQKRSLLKKNDRYSLEVLKQERNRIDDRLKQRGFYYFNADYILFKIDTGSGTLKVQLKVTIKPETPEQSKQVYRIAEVNVYPDYNPGRDSLSGTLRVIDSVNYFAETSYIRPEPVLRSIFLKNNTVYNRRKYILTLNHLNGLGVFKFVNIHIAGRDTIRGWLSADIFLSPLPQKSISVEMQGVSKSNNFIGPALNFSLRNRNAFRGAELLIYNLRGSFETQLNGVYKGKFTYEINPRIELYIPGLHVPFKVKINSNYAPKTKYIIDYSYLSRVGYFDLNSLKFTYGYKWKQSLVTDHDLSVISINYFKIINASQNFNKLINSNIALKRRFEEQLIAGMAYSFFYNEQVKQRIQNPVYFNGNIELAGNAIALYKKIFPGETNNNNGSLKLFGITFAQFVRLDIDVRKYYKLTEKTKLAGRFIAGWGLPYGNAHTMPYIKQFFSGGAYSIRGFQAYSIGPGSFSPPDSLKRIFFLQQGGEIKLEANVEYRFPIISIFKGALFADAGNVWLNKNTVEIPNSAFALKTFLSQVAVGIGTGLRIDLNFFVLRLDLGIPARKPWLPEKQRWVINNFKLEDSKWRGENLMFNIAFGYPF